MMTLLATIGPVPGKVFVTFRKVDELDNLGIDKSHFRDGNI